MSAGKHTLGHGLSPRVIRVAALLAERFLNPDVAAYGRSTTGSRFCGGRYITPLQRPRRAHFWFVVGRALSAAYSRRGCPTDYERSVRAAIDTERAAMAKASGAAA